MSEEAKVEKKPEELPPTWWEELEGKMVMIQLRVPYAVVQSPCVLKPVMAPGQDAPQPHHPEVMRKEDEVHLRVTRQRIIEWLVGTRWASLIIETDDELVRIAEDIGVTADALAEARVLHKEGLNPEVVSRAATRTHYTYIRLSTPLVILKEWEQLCYLRGTTSQVLARSLLHTYLQGTWQPKGRPTQWVWQGQQYVADHDPGRPSIRTRVTYGLTEALQLRAKHLGCSKQALMRGIFVSAINGEWGQPGTVPLVDVRQLYRASDSYEKRFWAKFRHERGE